MNRPVPKRDYIAQLDGLRAVAVLLVLFYHVQVEWYFSRLTSYRLVNGRLGVMIFFCLSGFLITRNLLYEKEHGGSLRSFWLRRAGRIFPIYWLTLLVVGAVWGVGWPVLTAATYTINFAVPFWGVPDVPIDHAWSLCVEEHFYLLWPLLVFGLPRRVSHAVAWATVAGGVGVAALLTALSPRMSGVNLDYLIYLGTQSQSAVLALGALVAYGEGRLRGRPWRLFLVAMGSLATSRFLPPVAESASRLAPADWEPFTVWGQQALLGFAILLAALASEKGWPPLRELLRDSRMLGLGRVSYGMYLYHPLVYYAFGIAYTPVPAGGDLRVIAALATTILVAAGSYRFVERPILAWVHRSVGDTAKRQDDSSTEKLAGVKPASAAVPS
jgi:peptidoglycan/LPS O-acetylase OafA/YrhL